MHFCLTGQYTPRALNAILENPTTNRQEAAKKTYRSGWREVDIDVQLCFGRPKRSGDFRCT
jgi:hypothetical protein